LFACFAGAGAQDALANHDAAIAREGCQNANSVREKRGWCMLLSSYERELVPLTKDDVELDQDPRQRTLIEALRSANYALFFLKKNALVTRRRIELMSQLSEWDPGFARETKTLCKKVSKHEIHVVGYWCSKAQKNAIALQQKFNRKPATPASPASRRAPATAAEPAIPQTPSMPSKLNLEAFWKVVAARSHVAAGAFDEAISALYGAVAIDAHPNIVLSLAIVFDRAGDRKNALDYYRMAALFLALDHPSLAMQAKRRARWLATHSK
jgi:tetratricopeptide (TPR) repeat protein